LRWRRPAEFISDPFLLFLDRKGEKIWEVIRAYPL
jgi:hypothetical protein